MGANVTVLGHSEAKRDEATKFGAQACEVMKDDADFKRLAGKFDFILNTTAVNLDINKYLGLLATQGNLTASQIGGIQLTQEMLNFVADHDVKPQIQMIGIDDVPKAYQNILDSKVRYRYVIDMSTPD